MIIHPTVSVLIVVEQGDSTLDRLLSYLTSIDRLRLARETDLPHDLSSYDVIVTAHTASFTRHEDSLRRFVRSGRGVVRACLSVGKNRCRLFSALSPAQ